jgi:hypothetical protein
MVQLMLAPGGLNRTGAVDLAGVRNVLALRAKYTSPAKPLGDASSFVDTSLTQG